MALTHQAQFYDILPAAIAKIDNGIGLEKLSAYGQFFVGATKAVI